MIEIQSPSPVETAPLEEVTPIRPSEALRLGRLVRPEKCTGSWTRGDNAACALGAMEAGWDIGPNDTCDRLTALGVDWYSDIAMLFDPAEREGRDGDAAVLAYLESRGL
jgi:hypothetical protein